MTRSAALSFVVALVALAPAHAGDDPFVGDFVLRGTEGDAPTVVELAVRKDAAGYSVRRSARYATARDDLYLLPAQAWIARDVSTRPSKAGPLLVVDYALPTVKTPGVAGALGKPPAPAARFRGIYRVDASGQLQERVYNWRRSAWPTWSLTHTAGSAIGPKLARTLDALRELTHGLDFTSERAGVTPIDAHGFPQRGGLSPEGIAPLLGLEGLPLTRGDWADEQWRGEVDPAALYQDARNREGFQRLFTSFAGKVVRPGVFYVGGDETDGGLLGEFKVVFYGQTPAGDLLLLESSVVETP